MRANISNVRDLLMSTGLLALAGCVSSPAPDQMARTTTQTAPADLQLLCAGQAATSLGVDSSKVLPLSSRQLDATSYIVELSVGDKKSNCVIDAEGTVKSITPA